MIQFHRSYHNLVILLHFGNGDLEKQIVKQIERQILNRMLDSIISDDVISIPGIANEELEKFFPGQFTVDVLI